MKTQPVRRAHITIDFYNKASLEAQLSLIKNALINGVERFEQETNYRKYKLVTHCAQQYIEPREPVVEVVNGTMCETVKSRV